MTYLEYHDETSSKFWQIAVNGNSHTVTFGKIGTAGQSKTKEFATVEDCKADADKLIKSKKAKGYVEAGETPTITALKSAKNSATKPPTDKISVPKIDKQAMLTEFDSIIEQGAVEQVLLFLQRYREGNVTDLKKQLIKARKYWMDYQNLATTAKGWGWKKRGNKQQLTTIFIFGCGLLSDSDYNSQWHNGLFDTFIDKLATSPLFETVKALNPVLIQSAFDRVNSEDWGTDYWNIRFLEQQGLLAYDPKLFARALSILSIGRRFNAKDIPLNDYLKKFTALDILSRDLQALFEYDGNIQYQWLSGIENRKDYQYDNLWVYLIAEFVKQGKLERDWVLQKCIEIQSNLWTVNVKKVYKDIFNNLQPTEKELLNLQEPLFALLHSEFKPSVNFAIEKLKTILPHAEFQLEEYLAYLTPIMMNSELKGTVKILLSQFTTLLKDEPSRITAIHPLLTTALMINDLNLQERTAKLLAKYATTNQLSEDDWQAVQDNVAMVYEGLTVDTKAILADFLPNESVTTPPQSEAIVSSQTPISEYILSPQYDYSDIFTAENAVKLYDNWQDLLFALSHLQQTENVLDFELFLSSWIALKANNQFPMDADTQLQAILQPLAKRLEPWSHHEWTSVSRILGMFNGYFVDYYQHNDRRHTGKFYHYALRYKPLQLWLALLKQFEQLDKSNTGLPLLSLPSHYPNYIEPTCLIERIVAYEQQNFPVDLVDLAIASARMPQVNMTTATQRLADIKNPAIAYVVAVALGETLPTTLPDDKLLAIHHKQPTYPLKDWLGVCMTAFAAHHPTAQWQQKIVDKHTTYELLAEPLTALPYAFKQYKKWNGDNEALGDYVYFKPPMFISVQLNYIYQALTYLGVKDNFAVFSGLDISFERHLTPLNQVPNDLSIAVITGSYWIDSNQSHYFPLLNQLMQPKYVFNIYTQYFLANYAFSSKKEHRLAIAEVIAKAIEMKKFDPLAFAKHSQVLIAHNYAPVGRYVEVLAGLAEYGVAYQRIVVTILARIFDGFTFKYKYSSAFKKLLELYYQLLSSLNHTPEPAVIAQLDNFLTLSASLKPIIGKLKKLGEK